MYFWNKKFVCFYSFSFRYNVWHNLDTAAAITVTSGWKGQPLDDVVL